MTQDDGLPTQANRQNEHSSALSVAFQQGYYAPAGAPNPYRLGFPAHAEWAAGWNACIDAQDAESRAEDAIEAEDEGPICWDENAEHRLTARELI